VEVHNTRISTVCAITNRPVMSYPDVMYSAAPFYSSGHFDNQHHEGIVYSTLEKMEGLITFESLVRQIQS
jgi:hypothetical protein